mgnify:CR=1 FL=1
MSWMYVSRLPVMQALREVTTGPPRPLFGLGAKPRSLKQAGRRGGSTRKAMAFVARDRAKQQGPS